MSDQAHHTKEAVPDRAPLITVIIPTLCEAQRAGTLHRAIASIRAASKEPVCILLVVNGNRFDTGLIQRLKARPDITILQLAAASVTDAQLAGREEVKTEFFSYLDDDDEYLPGALDLRLQLLADEPTADLAVTEGYRATAEGDVPLYGDLSDVPADPIAAILKRGWLNSGNGLFRSASVTAKYFLHSDAHGEWTWLAFRLAMDGKRIAVSNRATFRYHDTQNSLSKSIKHSEGYIRILKKMLDAQPPKPYASLVRKRLAQAHHDHSVLLLEEGRILGASMHHFRSLKYLQGWKYLSYTRHIISALLPRTFKRIEHE